MKSKKEKFIKEQKEAATIKVKTLIIGFVWAATLIAALIGGWNLRTYDNARVNGEAHRLVEIVSKQDQQ